MKRKVFVKQMNKAKNNVLTPDDDDTALTSTTDTPERQTSTRSKRAYSPGVTDTVKTTCIPPLPTVDVLIRPNGQVHPKREVLDPEPTSVYPSPNQQETKTPVFDDREPSPYHRASAIVSSEHFSAPSEETAWGGETASYTELSKMPYQTSHISPTYFHEREKRQADGDGVYNSSEESTRILADGEKTVFTDLVASSNHALQPVPPLHLMVPVITSTKEKCPSHEHVGVEAGMTSWEQENYRYDDYSWKTQEYACSDFHDMDEDNENNNDVSLQNNNNNSSSSSSSSNNSGAENVHVKRSDSTSSRESGRVTSTSSRRRRKRVQTPVQRSAANMRERRRMCHLNVAFDRLKEHLPNVKDKKKLSRIQTLKAAIYYIHLLRDSLDVY